MRPRCLMIAAAVGLTMGVGCASRGDKPSAPAGEASHEPTAKQAAKERAASNKPTRIILLIGDGMGVPEITAASYANGRPLAMLGMDEMSFMTTHSYEYVTTDSAASATALATGHKTQFGGVSVKPGTTSENETDDNRHYQTVLEKAEQAGWKTGLVATSQMVHATPAAFAAHRAERHSYEDIAQDMYRSGVDVLVGGGPRYFSGRSDGKNLVKKLQEGGYTLATSRREIRQASKLATRLVAFPHDPVLAPAGSGERTMSLAEMTRSAIDVLDRDNDKGFFLMVEGSQIDWRGHELDGHGVVEETLDFDGAVAAARNYARGRDDTLVVVTGDHETGGMAILDNEYAEAYLAAVGGPDKMTAMTDWPKDAAEKSAELSVGTATSAPEHKPLPAPAARIDVGGGATSAGFGPRYARDQQIATVFGNLSLESRSTCQRPEEFSGLHTPAFIPVFAEGKAADYVVGTDDNADLGGRLMTLVGREGAPISNGRAGTRQKRLRSKPRNIIVMIGDGMGISSLTAAYYGHGSLAMRKLPVKGLAATHAADRIVTDSAAGATALATGRATNAGAVGMARTKRGLEAVQTLVEKAEASGMQTGLVTTTRLTHATPAAFYAHRADRGREGAIAHSFVDMADRVDGSDGIDVAMGAGADKFTSEGLKALREAGVVVEQDKWADDLPAGKKVVEFLGKKGLAPASERIGDDDSSTPTLAEMTRSAIDRLSKSKKGFVLMVEGGQIDWAQHAMKRDGRLIDEVVDFDGAVGEAYGFARRDGDTLVVVTADHDHTTSVIDDHYGFDDCSCGAAAECGGDVDLDKLPVAVDKIDHSDGLNARSMQGKYGPPQISIQYAWLVRHGAEQAGRPGGPHSANFVPVFAYGPGADKFGGFHRLPQIGQMLDGAL